MSDNESSRDAADHVLIGEDFDVARFARKFQLTIPEARQLFAKYGNDRVVLEREAHALGSSPNGDRTTD
ncbi:MULTISPECIES: DUF3606 domain-containing protein [unclassified Mesorhizobium]|uniref:DUF3606 domain-containing protein n=1 Tax=unclassified Mesorhizobium TaxID=325217 RepID=UPI000FC9FB21|nr:MULTISPECIES: DUF3606 domain-containing protein [unclassified Mesorhizobium]RWD59465.1 MAG: DUF3606 domain-containing protein [Mesorhizobium sp.]RWE37328.1 MAG: DUF3606 domain-containing protein [Mesorhizobium sp.]TGP20360.1 DUF3606 domain-containing protein [Mesorhizobium sp. M1D.F.Ca.ET.231.01.1.1]TGP27836.1 DUF3606 domain-containing protein [Mesorhizobium sp. M1D.F.Ca.ET.234.01.1.1]TGS42186.1 DUF3606 domain-containing protein [Mesorhizobium sp. M1D.F.Ca.ET.184.01.1.1]